jgi:hypothetical protein
MAKRLTPVVLLAACLLGGCGGAGGGDDDPDYTPKSAEAMYAEIGDLDGVTRVDVTEYESAGVGTGPRYNGQVRIDGTADPALVLDQVFAILWQGMPEPQMNVRVRQGDTFYGIDSVGLDTTSLSERYGEQPGTGVPPTDQPPLELQE